nr:dienelactone hydrolase family protein [Pseudogemmobacter hezensis]
MLHGSGRTGRDMIRPWQGIAEDRDLVLLAPDALNSKGWSDTRDGTEFLEAVLAAAALLYPIDPKQVLIFGHSAGASFALQLAAAPPEGVTAVAVHAGTVTPVAQPETALPLRIYIGDNDHLFPLAAVRASAEALAAAGHPTDLLVIAGHDHWFYDAGPGIAADAWDWFTLK